jgi:hypothetical protein
MPVMQMIAHLSPDYWRNEARTPTPTNPVEDMDLVRAWRNLPFRDLLLLLLSRGTLVHDVRHQVIPEEGTAMREPFWLGRRFQSSHSLGGSHLADKTARSLFKMDLFNGALPSQKAPSGLIADPLDPNGKSLTSLEPPC